MQPQIQDLERLMQLFDQSWPSMDIHYFGIWSNRGWDGPARSFELAYYFSGNNIIIHDDQKPLNIKEGNLLFLNDSVRLSRSPGGTFKAYYFSFSFKKKPDLSKEVRGLFERLAPDSKPLIIPGLERSFANMLAEFRLNRSISVLVKQHFLQILLQSLYAVEYYGGNRPSTTQMRHQQVVESTINQLNDGYQNKLRLSDIAKQHGFNERYLNQVFKQNTGISLGKYLTRIRIEHAKRLLLTTTLSITDIAMETGFYDASHFCKMFKLAEQMTPAEFQAQY